MDTLPISPATWSRLVEANKLAVEAGWAEAGVFGTGVGTAYGKTRFPRLLYVGKSAGPLGGQVGSVYDQNASCRASQNWMMERMNRRSPFWQFIEQLDETRQHIAWTNISKMDQRNPRDGTLTQPSAARWRQIAEPCLAALAEEMNSLKPKVIVFATSKTYRPEVRSLFPKLGFTLNSQLEDDRTSLYIAKDDKYLVETKHPQGWNAADRDRVVALVKSLMN